MIDLNLPVKTEAWYNERRKGIGGSDAAVVMGMSPWKTAFRLYKEKRKEIAEEEIGGKEFVYWGTRLEAIIREEYESRTGNRVIVRNQIVKHPKYPWMLCNLDGEVPDVSVKTIVEIKNVGLFQYFRGDWGEEGTDAVPAYYFAQAQHNMIVTDAKFCAIPVLIGGNEFKLYGVPRNDEYCERAIEAERLFWKGVVDGIPPDPVNIDDLKLKFPQSIPTMIEAEESIAQMVSVMKVCKRKIKETEGDLDRAKFTVQSFMQENDTLTFNGEIIATWRKGKKSRSFLLKGDDDANLHS